MQMIQASVSIPSGRFIASFAARLTSVGRRVNVLPRRASHSSNFSAAYHVISDLALENAAAAAHPAPSANCTARLINFERVGRRERGAV